MENNNTMNEGFLLVGVSAELRFAYQQFVQKITLTSSNRAVYLALRTEFSNSFTFQGISSSLLNFNWSSILTSVDNQHLKSFELIINFFESISNIIHQNSSGTQLRSRLYQMIRNELKTNEAEKFDKTLH